MESGVDESQQRRQAEGLYSVESRAVALPRTREPTLFGEYGVGTVPPPHRGYDAFPPCFMILRARAWASGVQAK
jgi:hypothetical protein